MCCRKYYSATTFTVLSVVNKFLTVFINVIVWSHHASALGEYPWLTISLHRWRSLVWSGSQERCYAASEAGAFRRWNE
eukprot:scaffold8103_cov403-Prasinococcus_capsulatus_cf.AAC.7